ncbi:hypothetical protein OQA88_13144 [Cercophora sp. LCS_1]
MAHSDEDNTTSHNTPYIRTFRDIAEHGLFPPQLFKHVTPDYLAKLDFQELKIIYRFDVWRFLINTARALPAQKNVIEICRYQVLAYNLEPKYKHNVVAWFKALVGLSIGEVDLDLKVFDLNNETGALEGVQSFVLEPNLTA